MASSVSGQDNSNPAHAVIGYPSGQDGAILPAQDYLLCSARGQDGWVLATLFFCKFMDLYSILAHKQTKKNLANIQPS